MRPIYLILELFFSNVAGGKWYLIVLMCIRIITGRLNIFHVSLPSVFSLMGNAFANSHTGCFFLLIYRNSPNTPRINLLPVVYFADIFSLMWIFLEFSIVMGKT